MPVKGGWDDRLPPVIGTVGGQLKTAGFQKFRFEADAMQTDPNGISMTGIPEPSPGFHLETFEDELVLYHTGSTRALYLNPAAALIFRLCDGKRSLEDISRLIGEAYPDSAGRLEEDLLSAVGELVRLGAVHFRK